MIGTQFQLMTGEKSHCSTFDILPTPLCTLTVYLVPSKSRSVPVFGDTAHRVADTSLQVIAGKEFSLVEWSLHLVYIVDVVFV